MLGDLARDRGRLSLEGQVDRQRRVDLRQLGRWELDVDHRPDHPHHPTFRVSVLLSHPSIPPHTRGQGLGPADDLHDLGRDLVLPCPVRLARQDLDEVLRVVGRGLHRAAAGRVLRRGRLEQRGVDLRHHVLREQVVEDLLGLGLEQVLGVDDAQPFAGDLLRRDREEALRGRAERERGAEVGVGGVELVDLLVREVLDEGAADTFGLLVRRDLAEPLPGLAHRHTAEAEVPDALLARRRTARARARAREPPGSAARPIFSTFALYAPASPRSDVTTSTPAFVGFSRSSSSGCTHRARLPGEVLHRLGQLDRVGAGGLDALLRLDDPRRRDELHRARDLLRRLDRADPPADDAELARPLGRVVPSSSGSGTCPSTSSSSASAGPPSSASIVLVVVVHGGHPVPADVGLHLVGRRAGAAAGLAAGRGVCRLERLRERLDGLLERRLDLVGHVPRFPDRAEDVGPRFQVRR